MVPISVSYIVLPGNCRVRRSEVRAEAIVIEVRSQNPGLFSPTSNVLKKTCGASEERKLGRNQDSLRSDLPNLRRRACGLEDARSHELRPPDCRLLGLTYWQLRRRAMCPHARLRRPDPSWIVCKTLSRSTRASQSNMNSGYGLWTRRFAVPTGRKDPSSQPKPRARPLKRYTLFSRLFNAKRSAPLNAAQRVAHVPAPWTLGMVAARLVTMMPL